MKPRSLKADYCTSRLCGIPKYVLWLFLGVIVVAIVVPIGVMFGRKKSSAPKGTVLVPLYVYPSPQAWDPLYTAVTNYPHLNFTVVVNPASGPGVDPTPDGNYTREIPKLNSYANVRTVGYVSTSYTNRNISLALHDIDTYSAWAESPVVRGLGLSGIFLDEAPSAYQASSAQYLVTLGAAVNSHTGFGNDPLIIHNPGTIPDPRYLPAANLTVVFEGTYAAYQMEGFHKAMTAFQGSANVDRNALACVVHDIPSTTSNSDECSLVRDLRSSVGSIFITGLSVDYYASFWDGWLGFVSNMAA